MDTREVLPAWPALPALPALQDCGHCQVAQRLLVLLAGGGPPECDEQGADQLKSAFGNGKGQKL